MKQLIVALAFLAWPAAAMALTAEDLAGTWCFSHYEAGGEREDENITYVFHSDGTLQYQNSSSSAVDNEGTFRIEGDSIEIKPTLMMFNLTIKSASEERLVLDGLGEFFFLRGKCG